MEVELRTLAEAYGRRAHVASQKLRGVSTEQKNDVLKTVADQLRDPVASQRVLAANAEDLARAREVGLSAALMDRLELSAERLMALADAVEAIVGLDDPVGQMGEALVRPNGLEVRKMKTPLGVIFMIYESRPNVTIDAAALCLKASNAVLLRGGKEALRSNTALAHLFCEALAQHGLPRDALVFVDTPDRALMAELLKQKETVDLVIPRGGTGLITAVTEQSQIPVLQHYQGICHVYVHEEADMSAARAIALNAKVQRPGVCNAMECLVVDEAIAERFLPEVCAAFLAAGVELRLCERSRAAVPEAIQSTTRAATAQDFDTEFLSLVLAVKTVKNFDDALDFLNAHGSGHTESIITQNNGLAQKFLLQVDASCVMHNASTRFNDGGELGLGAELGISTTKLHAYGPMGLNELCTEKFVVLGEGQVRA